MRDAVGPAVAAPEAFAAVCRELFARRGYKRVETPLMEETELFLRKSGGELASRLYSFTEPGGHPVSLRPEYTAPVLRHAIENGALDRLPLRYQYCGPVFRHTGAEDVAVAPGQFIQLGAELIGPSSPMSDGEIIAMCWDGLTALGVKSPGIMFSHTGLLWEVLKPFELSEKARLLLVNSVGELRGGRPGASRIREQAGALGLVGTGRGASARSIASSEGDSVAIVQTVLGETLEEPLGTHSGVRSTAEIVARLARKITATDSPAKFNSALDLLTDIAQVRGSAPDAAKEAGRILKAAGQESDPVGKVVEVIEAAVAEGVPQDAISVDLGLARGIAYYTGMTFEVAGDNGVSLGGGGRYDGLARSLGSDRDVPALGFAYNLDALIAHNGAHAANGPPSRPLVVSAATAEAARAAARHAARLRERGEVAILDVDGHGIEDARSLAKTSGARALVVVTSGGQVREESF